MVKKTSISIEIRAVLVDRFNQHWVKDKLGLFDENIFDILSHLATIQKNIQYSGFITVTIVTILCIYPKISPFIVPRRHIACRNMKKA